VPWPALVLSSAGATAGYAATAAALKRWIGPKPSAVTRRDVGIFLLVVALGALLGSVLRAGALWAMDVVPAARIPAVIHRACIGDDVGLVVTLPVLWVLASRERTATTRTMLRSGEWWVVALVTVAGILAVFAQPPEEQFKFFYVLFLPVVWAAAPVLAFAIKGGWRWAAFASTPVAAANLIERGQPARDTVHNVILVWVASIAIGYVVEVARASERTLARALEIEAATRERERLARDIHDSVIQPYIGLQIALGAIDQKLEAGDANVGGDIKRLREQVGMAIGDLRSYVRGLNAPGEHESVLLGSLRRFAATFAEATGIAVDVRAADDLRLNDRLAAEVFQMVAEGLSNVRRHTQAARVTIDLAQRDDHLVVQIADEGTPGSPPTRFTPRSLTERAAALGGRASVERQGADGTRVVIEIPL